MTPSAVAGPEPLVQKFRASVIERAYINILRLLCQLLRAV